MDRLLRIVAWNANGLKARRNELTYFLSDLDVDVALISETHLTPGDAFRVPSYAIYRTDRPARQPGRNPGGGTAVIVHRRLVHRRAATASDVLESTGVYVNIGGSEVLIVAVYHASDQLLDVRSLHALLTGPEPLILAGDFNAKHRSWNSRTANARGVALRRLLDQLDDVVVAAPPGPTFIPGNPLCRPDLLDFALHRSVPFAVTASNLDALSSDHLPVLLTVDAAPTTRFPPNTARMKTDWRVFSQLLMQRQGETRDPTSAAELDDCVTDLHALLTNAVTDSSAPAPAQ